MTDNHPRNQQTMSGLARFFERISRLAETKALLWILIGLCVSAFLLNFTFSGKGHFSMESVPGFYGLFGAACVVVITFAAKAIGKVLQRDETYYGEFAVDSEEAGIERVERDVD